jgi:hypothetical protein
LLEGKSNTITCYKNQKEFNQLKSSACNNKTGFNVSQLIKTFEPQTQKETKPDPIFFTFNAKIQFE